MIAIIGAGPIGIELAAALKVRGVPYRHFEAGEIGATVSWWAPQTRFFSSPDRIAIAGVPLITQNQEKATREEYLAYLRCVVSQYRLVVDTFTRVTSLKQREDEPGFSIIARRSFFGVGDPRSSARSLEADETSEQITAGKVILTIGDMHRPRRLGIPGESLPHVSHYFDDPHRYIGKRVLIVGAKNSAVETAIRLARVGATVTMTNRRGEFDRGRIKSWLYPELVSLLRCGKVECHFRTIPVSIDHRTVTLAPTDRHGRVAKRSSAITLPSDFVFLLTGYEQDKSLFDAVGVELEGEGGVPKFNPETMETNVPGVYVAGTAAGGTQFNGVKLFIENCHVHVERIVQALTGDTLPHRPLRSEGELET